MVIRFKSTFFCPECNRGLQAVVGDATGYVNNLLYHCSNCDVFWEYLYPVSSDNPGWLKKYSGEEVRG